MDDLIAKFSSDMLDFINPKYLLKDTNCIVTKYMDKDYIVGSKIDYSKLSDKYLTFNEYILDDSIKNKIDNFIINYNNIAKHKRLKYRMGIKNVNQILALYIYSEDIINNVYILEKKYIHEKLKYKKIV